MNKTKMDNHIADTLGILAEAVESLTVPADEVYLKGRICGVMDTIKQMILVINKTGNNGDEQ